MKTKECVREIDRERERLREEEKPGKARNEGGPFLPLSGDPQPQEVETGEPPPFPEAKAGDVESSQVVNEERRER